MEGWPPQRELMEWLATDSAVRICRGEYPTIAEKAFGYAK